MTIKKKTKSRKQKESQLLFPFPATSHLENTTLVLPEPDKKKLLASLKSFGVRCK